MPDNTNNDYNELAKLIYPSIEVSGNVYYGQTRKLAIDELFNINDGGFESNIKTVRRQTDDNEDGFEYISYFCWKFGPLNDRLEIKPCNNDKFVFTFSNFPGLEKIYNLDDTYITNQSTDPIVGTLFIRYKLLLNDNTVEYILNSGNFSSYEKIISLDTDEVRVYITDNCDPTNVDNRDIDDRNIFVKHESDAYYLFVKLCKCSDIENPGDALYFTNINGGESTVKLIVNGELQTDYEYYKSYTTGWQNYTIGDTITLANRNDKVYFRGSRNGQSFASVSNYIKFNLTGKLSVGGNINSLLSPDESVYKNITDYTTFENANEYTFWRLFYDQSALVDASLLKLNTNKLAQDCYQGMFQGCTGLTQAPDLPATKLAYYCYCNMFQGCTSLVQAPELPAIILANNCYDGMFFGCASLVQAPELPAIILANNCYNFMFPGCASLTQAPELPATTLSDYCYNGMFFGCTSLTQAPELPATTLSDYCYNGMFYGCNKLNYVKCLATDISATDCTDSWLNNVAAIGTFECDNKKYFTIGSSSGIPKGWTITELNPDPDPSVKPDLDTFDPEIPFCIENVGDSPAEIGLYNFDQKQSTELRNSCKISYDLKTWSDYKLIFANSTMLSSITMIPLPNKGDRVYIKASLANTGGAYTYTRIVTSDASQIRARGNIASLNKGNGDAYKTDYLTMNNAETGCYTKLFSNCKGLIQAPELPATTLAISCYDRMFMGCTGLTEAPELPTTELSDACYQGMFSDCTSLVQAPELPATTLTASCYYSMFSGCTGLVKAPELPATTLPSYCYDKMFNGCSSLNYIKCLATDTSATYCTYNWVNGVSATGDFYCPASTVWPTGNNADIPAGWTRHDI